MHILRGIRMMMVRLMTRATCHCEMCATCLSEGGVPTMCESQIFHSIECGGYRVVFVEKGEDHS